MAYEERETGNLIGSDKVQGTAVYGADNRLVVVGCIIALLADRELRRRALLPELSKLK